MAIPPKQVFAAVAQQVEQFPRKEKVASPILASSSMANAKRAYTSPEKSQNRKDVKPFTMQRISIHQHEGDLDDMIFGPCITVVSGK